MCYFQEAGGNTHCFAVLATTPFQRTCVLLHAAAARTGVFPHIYHPSSRKYAEKESSESVFVTLTRSSTTNSRKK